MTFLFNIVHEACDIIKLSKYAKHLTGNCWVLFSLCEQRGNPKRKSENSMGFSYKEQFAVVVICKDEKEQEAIYNRLKAEGYTLKAVAV